MKIYTSEQMLDPAENISITKNRVEKDEPVHTHEFIELVYIWQGKGEQRIQDGMYPVEKGHLLFINYGQRHAFTSEGGMVYVNLLLRPAFMSEKLLSRENIWDVFSLPLFSEFAALPRAGSPLVFFQGRARAELETLIAYMQDEFEGKEPGYKSVLTGYMQVVFAKLLRRLRSPGDEVVHSAMDRLAPEILRYIDENYREKLSLAALAERCFYNPSYFSRAFKACYGRSFTAYIREKRMGEAVRLLEETDLSAEAVCERVGYGDRTQFYKAFREHTGVTPQLYRQNSKSAHKDVK